MVEEPIKRMKSYNPLEGLVGEELARAAEKAGVPMPKGKNIDIPDFEEIRLPADNRKYVVVKVNFTADNNGRYPQWMPRGVFWENSRDLVSHDKTLAALVAEDKSWKAVEGRLRAGRVDTADRKMVSDNPFTTTEGLWDSLEHAGFLVFAAKAYWKKPTDRDEEINATRKRRGQRPLGQKGCLEIVFVHEDDHLERQEISKAAGIENIGAGVNKAAFIQALRQALDRAFSFVALFSNSEPVDNITVNLNGMPDTRCRERVRLTLGDRGGYLAFRFEDIK